MSLTSFASLCSTCTGCIIDGHELDPTQSDQTQSYHRQHRLETDWRLSRKAGCRICSTLWKQLTSPQRASVEAYKGKEELTILLIGYDEDMGSSSGPKPLQVIVGVNPKALRVSGMESLVVRIFGLDQRDNIRHCYPSSFVNPSLDNSLTTAKKWLDRCLKTHRLCRSEDSDWLPTRLLDIKLDMIRLVLSNEIPQGSRYATLSHCWGTSKPLTLTKASFGHLRSGSLVETLPLTFRHAVEMARYFDVRYLWIDSLCIMQDEDDKTDWLHEALLMHKVYSGSYLNVAATASKGSQDGLELARDSVSASRLAPMTLTLPEHHSWTDGIAGEYVLVDKFAIQHDLMEAPLNKRGWVLQERMLSPRVLHFGSNQLYWECRTGLLCEQYPEKLPSWMLGCGFATFKSMTTAYGQENTPETLLSIWQRILTAYSQCMLTYPTDKLIALSGIAKHMQALMKDDYVAGMWRRYLACSLAWYVDDCIDIDRNPSTRPMPHRAPTWSWLSVDGVITSMSQSTDPSELHLKVLDTKMEYLSPDSTAQIKSGLLYVQGRLRRLQVRRIDPNDPYDRRWNLFLNGKILRVDRSGAVVKLDVYQPDFEQSNASGELYVMPCVGPSPTFSWHHMLLMKCVDRSSGTYERFGLATIRADADTVLLKMLLEHEEDEISIPHQEFDPVAGLHTIVVR